ncbi:DUF5590 domain-containing protein [Salinibacillus aidingensis]
MRHRWFRLVALIFFILFLIVAGSFIYVYSTAMEGKEATFEQSRQQALQETPLEEIESIVRYNGEKAYDVAVGLSEDETKGMAFVPVEKDEEITYVQENDGISKEKITSIWKEQCQDCTMQSITPGIENGNVIWEITYKNNDNQYVFETYLFENGDLYEQVKLSKK